MALFVPYRGQRENIAPRRKSWGGRLVRVIHCGMARLRETRDLVGLSMRSGITPRQTCFRTVRAGTHASATASSQINRSAFRRLILVFIATIPKSVMGNGQDRERPRESLWTVPLGLRDLVGKRGACNLPSRMTIDYASFVDSMWAAVETSFVGRERARFVAEGLLRGFDLGVDTGALRVARIFGNYESATKGPAREAMCKAIKERVDNTKTIKWVYCRKSWRSNCVRFWGYIPFSP